MRYLSLCFVVILACSDPSPYNKHGKFDFGQNPAGKNLPKYLYEHIDTVTHDSFHPQVNDLVIQLTRDENLSEKYLGKAVIRVTFASAFAFDNFVSVSLVNDNGKIYLIEKESYNHDIIDTLFRDNFVHHLEYDSIKKHFKQVAYSVDSNYDLTYQSESEIDPLIYSQKREVDYSVWEKAVSQLDKAVFAVPPSKPYSGVDGCEITIETHFPDGYYVVKRWSPRNDDFGTLAYSILWLGERSKIEGHLHRAVREYYVLP